MTSTFTATTARNSMQSLSMGLKVTISPDEELEGGDGVEEPPKVVNACPPKWGSCPSHRPQRTATMKWGVSEEHQLHGSGALPDPAYQIISRILDSSVIKEVVLGLISSHFQQYILGKSPVLGSSQALFQVDSLDNIMQCCLWTEDLLFAYDFISMVNYISFTAKVKRYTFLATLEWNFVDNFIHSSLMNKHSICAKKVKKRFLDPVLHPCFAYLNCAGSVGFRLCNLSHGFQID